MRSMSCGSSEGLERDIAVSRISESAGISKAAIYRYKED